MDKVQHQSLMSLFHQGDTFNVLTPNDDVDNIDMADMRSRYPSEPHRDPALLELFLRSTHLLVGASDEIVESYDIAIVRPDPLPIDGLMNHFVFHG